MGDEEVRIRPYDPRYTQAKTAFVQHVLRRAGAG